MNIRKTLPKQALVAIVVALCLSTPIHVAASVKLSLSGKALLSSHEFGSKGFSQDDHLPSNSFNHVYRKFKNNKQSKHSAWGLGWKGLGLTLGKRGNAFAVPVNTAGGFRVPHIRHPLLTELHYDGTGGLTFEGWYKNPKTKSWYDIGDRKVLSVVKHSQVPEPLSLLLASLGLFGIALARVRSKS